MNRHSVAVAALVTAACTSGDSDRSGGWAGTMDTLSGGTVVVKNPATGIWDSASAWRLEEDLRIGSVEGIGPDAFASIAHLEVDTAGRLYVLDRQAKDVRVFDANGAHVRTMGREGGGPGEFRDPIGIALDAAGRLWVVDPSNGRYTVFDSEGKFVTSHLRPISSYTMPWPGGFDSEGRLYDMILGVRGSRFGDRALIRFTTSVQPGDTIPVPASTAEATFRLVTADAQMITSVPFTSGLIWVFDRRSYLWFGMSDSYRIYQRASGGDTVRIIEREHQRLPVTNQDRAVARERLEWFTKQGGKVDESKFPALKPVFEQLLVDDGGNLWVRVTEPHGVSGSAFDVFDMEGRYLGQVRSRLDISSYPPPRITPHAMYAAVTGEKDEPQVVRLRTIKPERLGN